MLNIAPYRPPSAAMVGGSRYAWRLSRRMRTWGGAGRLRHALAVNPHDVKARTDLEVLLVRQGRFREPCAELEQEMPRADDLPEAHYALGLCLLCGGEVDRGRELVERPLVLNAKFGYGEPYLRLGDFRAELGGMGAGCGALSPSHGDPQLQRRRLVQAWPGAQSPGKAGRSEGGAPGSYCVLPNRSLTPPHRGPPLVPPRPPPRPVHPLTPVRVGALVEVHA